MFFMADYEVGQELCFLGLSVPVLLQVMFRLVSPSIAARTFRTALPYLIALSVSFVGNVGDASSDPVRDTVILLNTAYGLFLASILASWRDGELWADIMRCTAIIALPAFLYVAIAHRSDESWGRWMPYDLQPNWWGMMALGLAWSSLAWKNQFVRSIGLAMAIYYLYRTQSRGSLLGLVPAFILCSGYLIPLTRRKLLAWVVAGIVAALALGVDALLGPGDVTGGFADFVANDLLKLEDPNRGWGTGLTGRTEAFQEAWDAFRASPLIGNGYSEFGFVHNGYLITAAESGAFALFGLLYLFWRGLRGYGKAGHWVGIGFILSYMLTLATYPRTLNINMTALLFMFVLMRGIALSYMQRASPNGWTHS
ncbi:MAG TPA: O-antigen ligase family protein [Stellaceae bacterium]|nr:O-antigen ligase family protein [Stellaceae bacterium]